MVTWLSMTMETRISKIRKESMEETVQEMGGEEEGQDLVAEKDRGGKWDSVEQRWWCN